jgi:fluoroquinolone resistance protein
MISPKSDYTDQVFEDLRQEHDRVDSSEFQDCVFIRCVFTETVFQKCRFVNCVFQQCDLSLMGMEESSFSSVRFEDSKVIGINWAQADWTLYRRRESLEFYRCAISHSTFIGLRLPGIQIQECVAADVDFREADLSGANFAGTDLVKSMFGQTNLSKADLSRARNYALDPSKNNLKQAKFSLPEAMALLYALDIILTE